MFLLFFCYISLPVGRVLHDLKFRRVTQEFTFKQHFHTAIAFVVSGLDWRCPFDISGMERGCVPALPCQRVVLDVIVK